jgi:hypothetical protein
MKKMTAFGIFLFVAGVPAIPPLAAQTSRASRGPIVIATDSDFPACGCVASGSGTTADPYIIGPLAINGTTAGNSAISIDGTLLTKSFNHFNLTTAGNGSNSSFGIVLNHINPSGKNSIVAEVTGTQTSIQTNGVGILVENSNFVTLDGGGANPRGAGLARQREPSTRISSGPLTSKTARTSR